MGVALVAACWFLSVPAQAQFATYPSAVGAARMPEPIPCAPSAGGPPAAPPPNLVPGPISTQAAPMGPPDCLTLPYDHTGAFQCENYVQDCGFIVHVGPMALQRNKLGAGDIAVYNARAQGQPFGPAIPDPRLPAPAGTASALDFNGFTPPLSLGVRGTVGYLWDNQSVELSSFYVWQNDVSTTVHAPGMLDTLFYNPPFTFLGDSMFRRADQVTTRFGSSLFSSELNYRRWNSAVNGLEFLIGLRYVRQNDLLGITTQGEAFVNNSAGLPVPGPDMAMYNVICHNNIIAPQVGVEYSLPIFGWLSVAADGKAALGGNYITSDVSLTRGDGLTAFDTHRHAWNLGQIYQLGAYADFHILQKLQLRLGYTATWLCGVAVANDQVDFNLRGNVVPLAGDLNKFLQAQQFIPHGNTNNNGSLLYFGPQIELQFFF
jgi:hypothetical protein